MVMPESVDHWTGSGSGPRGELTAAVGASVGKSLPVDSLSGRIEGRRAPDEEATPLGQPPFFVDFPREADLLDPFVAGTPLAYFSLKVPQVRDLFGTLLLSVSTGAVGTVCQHAASRRGQSRMGMCRAYSDDSVRRAITEQQFGAAQRAANATALRSSGST